MSLNHEEMDMEWNKMIESHLNSSLDIEGISVSEDLIQRTLMKIREQSDQEQIDDIEEKQTIQDATPKKRVINPWIQKVLPTVAAAAILLFVGKSVIGTKTYNEISNGTAKNDAAAPEEQTGIAMDSATNDMVDEGAGVMQEKAIAPMEGITSVPQEYWTTEEGNKESTMAIRATESDDLEIQNDSYPFSFADINPITVDATSSIDITEATSDNSLFLSSKEDIKDFFDIMSGHQYAEVSKGNGKEKFTIRISGDGVSYTIKMDVGYITTNYIEGDQKVDGRYEVFDHLLLLAQLEELYTRLNQ